MFFEYDALGRCIGKTEKTTEGQGTRTSQETTRFVWQGLRLVQEVNADDVRSYVYSPDAAYTPLARLDVVNVDEVPADFRTTAMLRPRMLRFYLTRYRPQRRIRCRVAKATAAVGAVAHLPKGSIRGFGVSL